MTDDEKQKFFMDLSMVLNDLRQDLELVLDSKTDISESVLNEFKAHMDRAEKLEGHLDDVVLALGLKRRGL